MAEASAKAIATKPSTKPDPEDLEAGVNLFGDLRNMVDRDDYCDITFQCQDGKPVRASRALLMGRSSFFRTLLRARKDSEGSDIVMDKVSSAVLLSVIEFLYTGEMVKYRPQNLKMTFEIINAAVSFRLQSLEAAVRRHLLNQVHIYKLTRDLTKAATMLSVGLEFRNLLERDPLLPNVVNLLCSNWTHSGYSSQLSEEAMHYLLSQTKPNFQEGDRNPVPGERLVYLREYYRLRQIMFWWFYRNASGWSEEVAERADSAVPVVLHISELNSNVQFIRPREKVHPSTESSTGSSSSSAGTMVLATAAPCRVDLHSVLTDESARGLAVKMLSHIELKAIPAILLSEVVIPLNVFPPLEALKACQYHLLRRPIQYETIEWIHGAAYKSPRGSFSIQKATSGTASAVTSLAMSSPCITHTWSISVEQLPDSFMEFGFVYKETGSSSIQTIQDLGPKLNTARLSRHLSGSSTVLQFSFAKKTVLLNWQPTRENKGGRAWRELAIGKDPREVSKITFQLHILTRTCSLNLDGVDLGIIWKELPPKGNFHPAVCLGSSDSGRVHFEFGGHVVY